MSTPQKLIDGLYFPEGARWHEGYLYFSDQFANQVIRIDEQGVQQLVVEVPGQPSGLGWDLDGHLLIASMLENKLYRFKNNSLKVVADVSQFSVGEINDMVVHKGHAYIGSYNGSLDPSAPPSPIIQVTPSGQSLIAEPEMKFPNGSVVLGDQLVIAESMAMRLSVFDLAENGEISNKRIWAELPGVIPDGICADSEGAIWIANPAANEVIRVHQGGEISERIKLEDSNAFCCCLGGSDLKTLFICSARAPGQHAAKARDGAIFTIRVDVPGKPNQAA